MSFKPQFNAVHIRSRTPVVTFSPFPSLAREDELIPASFLISERVIGCTVEIIEMCDPYRDMPAGLRGTVTHVDDTGTVFADWENGSMLGAVFREDRIRRVD